MARRAEGAYPPRRAALSRVTTGEPPELPTRLDTRPEATGRPLPGAADLPECTACGTCCFSTLPEYVRVFGYDWDRMDERARAFTHFLGNRSYLRLEEGHCAALRVDPSDAARPRFLCGIYEMRPDACRSLERGSGGCLGERHEKRERPLLAVARLLRRAVDPEPATPPPDRRG